jgi:hypothetical protein
LSLEHNGNGAIDFITDLVLHSGNHPSARYEDVNGELEVTGDHPCFVVVSSSIVERKYAKDDNSNVSVCKFVLMDGSGTLFKAVTNSSITCLCKYTVKPGSSLIVYDYELVWMHGFHEYEFRFVMLLNKCTWREPPSGDNNDLGRIVRSTKVKICRFAIEAAEKESIVVFTLPSDDHPERYCWDECVTKACTLGELENGDWIVEPAARCEWNTFITPLLVVSASDSPGQKKSDSSIKDPATWDMEISAVDNEDGADCQCVAEFGLCQCVCQTFPVDELDIYSIFSSACCRLAVAKDRRDDATWASLKPNH